jgi:PhnB protein
MPKQGSPIPAGSHNLVPYLVVRDADRAIDFYKKAFGAQEVLRSAGPDGKTIVHASLRIGDSMLFLTQENLEWGSKSPLSVGGTGSSIYFFTEDVDTVFQRAVDNGAVAKMPVSDAFWGDRWGTLTDPFGHVWQIATHKWDMTPEEMKEGQEKMFAAMASKKGS